MTEKEQVETETTEINEDVETEVETEETTEEPSKDDYYKAELEELKKAKEKAEKALAERAFKERKEKREEKDEEDKEDKPLTAKELEAILAKERQEQHKVLKLTQAEDMVGKMTTSDAEASLIMEIFKNRSFPEHYTLSDQIEESYAIANRKRIIAENDELKRALAGKDGISKDTSTTHQDPMKGKQPNLSPNEKTIVSELGFTFNNTSRRFEKKLGNGKILVRDPKTGQVQLA